MENKEKYKERKRDKDGNLDELLNQDKKINNLEDIELKELYLRYFLINQMKQNVDYTKTKEFEEYINKYTDKEGLRMAIIEHKRYFNNEIVEIAFKYKNESFINSLYYKITKQDLKEKDKLDISKQKLKQLTRQVGIPETTVIRKRLRDFQI